MEVLHSSYTPGGGGDTLNFSRNVDLDQASTIYPKNIRSIRHTPQNNCKLAAPPPQKKKYTNSVS